MISCSLILNRCRFTKLIVGTVQVDAFSGNGPHRNNPDSVGVLNSGPLPLGVYYIVDRESGGMFGAVKDWFRGKDKWFALYRDDGTIDDQTFVHSVSRGLFRLHPIGPARRSDGCVTVQNHDEFERVRQALLRHGKSKVSGSGVEAYGTLSVGRVLDPVHSPEQQEAAIA